MTALLCIGVSAGATTLGDGHRGALVVGDAGVVINIASGLTSGADAGATTVDVLSSAGFAAGDLVVVHQTQLDFSSVDAGNPGPFDLGATALGAWELARVTSVASGRLVLEAPLVTSYRPRAQVVTVPEFTQVAIGAGASLVAPAWNGGSGGILAFLSQGPVALDGLLSATGAGFRGAPYTNDGAVVAGCTGFSTPAANGARRGEGVDLTRFSAGSTGAGNVLTGAGGGICVNSGGGGGGAAGAGGKGGLSSAFDTRRDVGGRGGAKLTGLELTERLVLGGGGGAGHGDNSVGTAGANGGGIIFVRATSLTGQGRITASGTTAQNSGLGVGQTGDGAGGGGAGGTVSVWLIGAAKCLVLDASGGSGGNSAELSTAAGPVGPGGGGGGGWVYLRATDAAGCPARAQSGSAGTQPDLGFPPNYGAEPSDAGASVGQGNVSVILSSVDAGTADAGTVGGEPGADGGTSPGPLDLRVSCACGTSAPISGVTALLTLVLLRARSRRRLSPARSESPSPGRPLRASPFRR